MVYQLSHQHRHRHCHLLPAYPPAKDTTRWEVTESSTAWHFLYRVLVSILSPDLGSSTELRFRVPVSSPSSGSFHYARPNRSWTRPGTQLFRLSGQQPSCAALLSAYVCRHCVRCYVYVADRPRHGQAHQKTPSGGTKAGVMLLLWERGKSCQKHRADTIHAESRRWTARLRFQALRLLLFPVGIYANHPRSNLGHGWTVLLLVMIRRRLVPRGLRDDPATAHMLTLGLSSGQLLLNFQGDQKYNRFHEPSFRL